MYIFFYSTIESMVAVFVLSDGAIEDCEPNRVHDDWRFIWTSFIVLIGGVVRCEWSIS